MEQLTPCDECKTPTRMLWVLGSRWLCKGCFQKAKELPTLRQLVQARSARP